MESNEAVTVCRTIGGRNSASYQGNDEVSQPTGRKDTPDDASTSNLLPDTFESENSSMSATKYLWLRVLHAVLSGLNYGLALLLMLVAMTFNPSLFLALMTGYTVGDFVFYSKMRKHSLADCHN